MKRKHIRSLRGSVTLSPVIIFVILLVIGGVLAKDIGTMVQYRFGEPVDLTRLQPEDLTEKSVAVGTVHAVCMEVATMEHQTIEHDGEKKSSYDEHFYLCCCGDSYLVISVAHKDLIPQYEAMQAATYKAYRDSAMLPAQMLQQSADGPHVYAEGCAKALPADLQKKAEQLVRLQFDDPDAVLAAMPAYYLESGNYETMQYLSFAGCGIAAVGLFGLLGTLFVYLRRKRAEKLGM